MRVVDCAQGSDEWLAARCGIATASCFRAVLATIKTGEAADRRNYRARLVVERLTGRPVPSFTTPAMRQGTEREPVARSEYEVRTGHMVTEVGLCLHDSIEAGASPDGLIDTDGGIEIKCPELAAHLEYLRAPGIPPEYVAQVQGNLWVTGRRWWDFVSFNPDFPPNLQMVIRRVERDEKYISSLALAVKLFMEEVCAEEAAVRALEPAA